MSDPKYIAVDAAAVVTKIRALYAEFPDLYEDSELAFDTIDGETPFLEVVQRVLDQRQEAETMADAIKQRETALKERRERYERKSEAMRGMLKWLMQTAKQDKLVLPEATLSMLKPRSSVVVDDLDQLPQGYTRIKKEADKVAIAKAFENGEPVPGAHVVEGEPSLMVRTK